jgi:hypothetical protein
MYKAWRGKKRNVTKIVIDPWGQKTGALLLPSAASMEKVEEK